MRGMTPPAMELPYMGLTTNFMCQILTWTPNTMSQHQIMEQRYPSYGLLNGKMDRPGHGGCISNSWWTTTGPVLSAEISNGEVHNYQL